MLTTDALATTAPTQATNFLNLLIVDAPKAAISDEKQRELALALMELLIDAAQQGDREPVDGGGDEREADR